MLKAEKNLERETLKQMKKIHAEFEKTEFNFALWMTLIKDLDI